MFPIKFRFFISGLVLLFAVWTSGCFRPFSPVKPVIPTVSTPAANPTSTPTAASPSGCVTMGSHDPSPVSTIEIPPNNGYLSRVYAAGAICGNGFNEFQAYVGNYDAAPASLEVAVYDNGQLAADGTMSVPASSQGWQTASLPSFSIPCGDQVVLAVHSAGATLFVGASSAGAVCSGQSNTQAGSMPATYPDSAYLASPGSSSWCYEMSLDSCGSP